MGYTHHGWCLWHRAGWGLIITDQYYYYPGQLDCYTALVWWHWDCQRGMRHGLQLAGITLLWLAGLNINWDCLGHNRLGACDSLEFSPVFRGHWQSPCTALRAGSACCKGCARRLWKRLQGDGSRLACNMLTCPLLMAWLKFEDFIGIFCAGALWIPFGWYGPGMVLDFSCPQFKTWVLVCHLFG